MSRADRNRIPFDPIVCPVEPLTSKNPVLEIREVLWGHHVWSIRHVEGQGTIRLGEKDGLIPLPPGFLPGETWDLVTHDENRWRVQLWKGAQGEWFEGTQRHDLSHLSDRQGTSNEPHDDALRLDLSSGTALRLDFGPMQLLLRLVDKEPVPKAKLGHFFDAPLLAMLGVLLSVLGAFHTYLQSLPVPEVADLLDSPNRFPYETKVDLTENDKPKPIVAEKTNLRRDEPGKTKPLGPEGKIGKREATLDKAQGSARRALDEKVANSAGILGQAFSGLQNLDLVFGGGTTGAGLDKRLGMLEGPSAFDMRGTGGLGLRQAGLGGGGDAIGLGGLDTWGDRHGRNPSGVLGLGGPDRSKKARHDLVDMGKQAEVFGTVDKSMIQRVMRRYHNQIRYCYQRELSRNPNLYGKVTVRFLIAPDGKVSQSGVAVSSLRNGAVESCVSQVVQRIRFPPPQQLVAVRYPFLFSSIGQ